MRCFGPQQTEASPTQPEQQQQPPEELPIWVQREKMRELEAQAKPDLPWPLYLLLSVLVAIAAVSSAHSQPCSGVAAATTAVSVLQACVVLINNDTQLARFSQALPPFSLECS